MAHAFDGSTCKANSFVGADLGHAVLCSMSLRCNTCPAVSYSACEGDVWTEQRHDPTYHGYPHFVHLLGDHAPVSRKIKWDSQGCPPRVAHAPIYTKLPFGLWPSRFLATLK